MLTPEEDITSYHKERDRQRCFYRARPRPDKTAELERERARREGNLFRKQRARKLYESIKHGRVNKPDKCPKCSSECNRILGIFPNGSDDITSVVWMCSECNGLMNRKGPSEKWRKQSRTKIRDEQHELKEKQT